MEFTKTVNLSIGNIVTVLTTDGYETGEIEDFINGDIKIYVESLDTTDIYNIQDTINTYDLAMYICPNEHLKTSTQYGEKYIGWHAGIIISNNTMLSVDFLKDVEKRVSNNMYDIEADEDEFDHVFYQKKYNNKIKINSLTKYYKDNGPEFNVKNAVWSGQNVAKVDHEKYINEYSKYI